MKIKATILLGVLISAGALLAQTPDASQATPPDAAQSAQTPQTSPQRTVDPAKQAARLGRQLGLSSDQVEQITPILADRRQQMKDLREDTSLSQRDRRAKAKSILADS